VCKDGACQPFNFLCQGDPYEPNESAAKAFALDPPVTQGKTQICANDKDWYSLEIPAGHVGTVGMYFTHLNGDLDLCAYDEEGSLLGCRYTFEDYPDTWRGNDWNDEYLTGLALDAPRYILFKGDGWKGAVNDYTLTAYTKEWSDGPTCTDFYSLTECKGCNPDSGVCQKGLNKINLIQFPYQAPEDGYVGSGYVLEHSSSYRWVRRETIMLIRHAIHEVQLKFPGTGALGLMDMCQIDGITPGFDVGSPRHPESTHDEGGNIDVAYYQTGKDNLGKIICDPNGGSNNGYYCTDVDNHIVDLPRTAYMLGKLAESSRFRVAGADVLIAPLLLDELKKQKDKGWITTTAYNKLAGGSLAYGDGWSFHHHHIHVSLKWWSQGKPGGKEPALGCGFRMPGDGVWIERKPLRRLVP
jgi:hypothetical protein